MAAIIGTDDRHEVMDSPIEIQEISNSIAALVRKKNVIDLGNDKFKIEGLNYVNQLNFCPDTRFVDTQTMAANCSAFLIESNKIGTAGHCIEKGNEPNLDDYLVVFDYRVDSHDQKEIIVSKNQIFTPKKTLQYVFNFPKDKDVAVIELDRNVPGRRPLKLANSRVQKGEEIYILGFPFGLPMKFQDNGYVTAIQDPRGGLDSFTHNLDTFSVNSGSAIFSAKTNEIVGILVRGTGKNYEEDPQRSCNVWGGEITQGNFSSEGNYIDLLKL
jgi:V8-like Glu-specific endopeptidase